MTDNNNDEHKPGFFDIVKSTLWAALGVQNSKNRERDFKHGNIVTFAVAGLIFTVVFITIIVTIVKLVLKSSGL